MTVGMEIIDSASLPVQTQADIEHAKRTLTTLAATWKQHSKVPSKSSRWAKRIRAYTADHPAVCEVCGVRLVAPAGAPREQQHMLAALISPWDGLPRCGFATMDVCRKCLDARQGQDFVAWVRAHPDLVKSARIQKLLARRVDLGLKAANHPSRHAWRTKPPVERELRARWTLPRSVLFCAHRNGWDMGIDPVPAEPQPGLVAWLDRARHRPSDEVMAILMANGAQRLADALPGWVVCVVPGRAWFDVAWSLVEANAWMRRLALPDISQNVRPGKFPEPEPPAQYELQPGDTTPAPIDPTLSVVIQFHDLTPAAKARCGAVAREHREWVKRRDQWMRWPTPAQLGPHLDWWRTLYSVGQCTRRRLDRPRVGKFRERPMWHKPPRKRR